MPAHFELRTLARPTYGIFGAWLSHHQRRAAQHTLTMGVHNRVVDLGAEPEVVRDEYDLSPHADAL